MTVFHSDFPTVAVPEGLSFPEYLLREWSHFPPHLPALRDVYTDRVLTYGQLLLLVPKMARALVRQGLKKGDRFCMIADNSIEYPVVALGAALAGALVSFYNHMYTAEEMNKLLVDAAPVMGVTVRSALDKVRAACPSVRLFLMDGSAPDTPAVQSLLETSDLHVALPKIDPRKDSCFMPYSSGTTGLPKGVMLTHHNLVTSCVIMREVNGEDPNYVPGQPFLLVVPMFHVSGLVYGICYGLGHGKAIYVMNKFDPKLYLKLIEDNKMDTMAVVPPMLVYFNKSGLLEEYDLSSLRNLIVGAAPTDRETEEETRRLIPSLERISQGYGMTELTAVSVANSKNSFRAGSVGKIVPNTQMLVVDVDTGKRLGRNQRGELCFLGDIIMAGYWKRPEATRETIDGQGWLHTGDIGYIDDDGFVFIVDRLKELIKYKGYQVAPAELEGVILSHPDVADVAVVGVPDQAAGELPRAYVVVKPDRSLTADDVSTFVSSRLSPQKHLRGGVRFVKEVPKSATGKILRKILKAEIKAEQEMSKSKL